jgi:hypothetical protein
MTEHLESIAVKVCEAILLKQKQHYIEQDILGTDIRIIDRLLNRREELKDAYSELYVKFKNDHKLLEIALSLFIDAASQWNREDVKEAREDRRKLENVNKQISIKANELADLLALRSELINTSSFSSATHYHIANVICDASKGNPLFRYSLRDKLKILQGQFDLKYWPRLDQIIRVLAEDADHAELSAIDSVTESATKSNTPSKADYFRALFEIIQNNLQLNNGLLPDNFRLTDNTIATMANCTLAFSPEDIVDSIYVKNVRNRK